MRFASNRAARRGIIPAIAILVLLAAVGSYSVMAGLGPNAVVGGYSLEYYEIGLGASRGESADFTIENALKIGASYPSSLQSATYSIGAPLAVTSGTLVVPGGARALGAAWTRYE